MDHDLYGLQFQEIGSPGLLIATLGHGGLKIDSLYDLTRISTSTPTRVAGDAYQVPLIARKLEQTGRKTGGPFQKEFFDSLGGKGGRGDTFR